jgi:hypothetical protein
LEAGRQHSFEADSADADLLVISQEDTRDSGTIEADSLVP